jgi:hypothetical protein
LEYVLDFSPDSSPGIFQHFISPQCIQRNNELSKEKFLGYNGGTERDDGGDSFDFVLLVYAKWTSIFSICHIQQSNAVRFSLRCCNKPFLSLAFRRTK